MPLGEHDEDDEGIRRARSAALPQTVEASDDSQCDLPDDSDLWPLIALSCFRYDGRAVPILDGGRLFGSAHA